MGLVVITALKNILVWTRWFVEEMRTEEGEK